MGLFLAEIIEKINYLIFNLLRKHFSIEPAYCMFPVI